MLPDVQSLHPLTDPSCGGETIDPLLSASEARLEHIVSRGQPSPPEFWYDQDQAEWVLLLKGTATLRFDEGLLELRAGDALTIPAGVRHRVEAVSEDAVWLALHYQEKPGNGEA